VLEHAFDGSVLRGRVLSLLSEMRTGVHWLNYGPLTAALEQAAVASPDPDISLAALHAAHVVMAQRVHQAISERKRAASRMGDRQRREMVAKLEKADERLAYIIEGISLPEFARTPPSVFQVKTAGPAIRVLAIGDYGTGDQQQRAAAATMLALHRHQPFDFGITLGDNFQSFTCQMKSPDDPLWKSVFEDVYGPLGITFYPVFGNHDWACDMPISELLYSARSPHWRFPAPYYTYVAGLVQFFAINTQYSDLRPTASELAWLKAELDKSTAKWKVVYSHFPIFSSDYTDDKLVSRLLPVLRGRADVYINGHIHNLREHKPVDGVHFFNISASAGAGGVPINTASQGTAWGTTTFGFGVLEADDRTFMVRFIDADGKKLHRATLKK
jgi:predicted phosphodiesterase